jgi:hypothetical protein
MSSRSIFSRSIFSHPSFSHIHPILLSFFLAFALAFVQIPANISLAKTNPPSTETDLPETTPPEASSTSPKIYIAFHWHMHQPIYWPYESVVQTENRGSYSFSLREVHTSRSGAYTTWPANAVQAGINAGFDHFGAQVSFSGSLIENLQAAQNAGWGFGNWTSPWNGVINQTTSLGNRRMEMTGFGYHHPLMPLTDTKDIRKQVQWHKEIMGTTFAGSYSKGIFPPETAFSTRIIPALVEEGFEWVIVDNLHFERAAEGAPVGDQSSVKRPNKADIRNPNPGDWVQLNGLWAPMPVSAQWGHQPKYVSFTDPETGEKSSIIAVPASRYLGNEDGRGGFGALQYDAVMSQLESYNTDPDHPILLVLHHDGDNHGGGSDSYYNSNFQAMISWLQQNSHRFEVTTIQDYLEMFPPDPTDEIHIQDGSWLGADGGDPEFKKWLGDEGSFPGAAGPYSPDQNSWGVITAAKNFVETADQINPNHSSTEQGWKYFLNGQASDYWYWDGTEMWDSHPARASNLAINEVQSLVSTGQDQTGPSMFVPQRTPYNPGAIEWDGEGVMPSDVDIWTYVFDVNGVVDVTLYYRVSDNQTVNSDHLTYAGGASVGEWTAVAMQANTIPSITNPQPLYKADEYRVTLTGLENQMVDYFVEAKDELGNTSRSIIQHVWIGNGNNGGGGGGGTDPNGPVSWSPENPSVNDVITLTITNADGPGNLHWGVNTWSQPDESYWPENSFLFQGNGPAIQTPMELIGTDTLQIQLGPFNDTAQDVSNISFVISYQNGNWDNNSGNDYFITLSDEPPVEEIEVAQNYNLGWNLVSLPGTVNHTTFTELFPTAISGTLYSFDGGYQAQETLVPGTGYWVNLTTADEVTFTITPDGSQLEIPLTAGWNLISGGSSVGTILDPDDIITPGTLYEFDGVYQTATELTPGKGYWISAELPGTIVIQMD